jgi:ATP/ADP translocase
MDRIKQLSTQPRPKAILLMTVAMALHFGGYEFTRSGLTTLFTSNDFGFSSPSAFPLAMGLVSPFSVLLLMGYGHVLETQGPRAALKQTTLFSLLFLSGSALALHLLRTATTASPMVRLASQAIVALAFIYQNAYAYLLYTQQWSFLSSITTPEEGSVWFAAIAGVSSVVSTLTGAMVKPLVNAVGLIGMVACTSVFLAFSLVAGDQAYELSQTNGFDPVAAIRNKQQKDGESKQQQEQQPESLQNSKSLLWIAKDLFQRVPTLGFLFGEVLTFQALSVILNLAMITQLKVTMPMDADRAAWLGRFFSATNGLSGILQFIVIPSFMKRIEPSVIWKFMPLIPFACSIFQSFQGLSPSLWILGLSFFATKTMDYSIRGVVSEMVYQPLDFDSRYLGKEIIGLLGSRFGKSGTSILLSGLTYIFPAFGIYHLSKLSVLASAGWLSSCWALSKLMPRKAEAQEAFLEQRRQHNKESTMEDQDKKKEE